MKLGVTVGKFYPFHRGHDYLIRQAKAQVEQLVVVVGAKPEQAISGNLRGNWIRVMHPDVEVYETLDDLPEAPEPWAKRTLELLGGRQPDVAFTSEAYGEPWAALMGARHIAIDCLREAFPISGTQLRQDLATHWQMLTPPAKAYFAKRIAVVGVESSGTTTLARSLAKQYQTVWVPEYGRWYWEGRQYLTDSDHWDSEEFIQIAQGQIAWEEALAIRANRLVVCDTDPLATCIWHRRYLGSDCEKLQQIAASRNYDLYLLTAPDFGFVQDGTRESESLRMSMHIRFLEELERQGKSYILVEGSHEGRMVQATEAIAQVLKFPSF
ncbi:AAA family ATPase [Oscillatoria sp. HE19RPO]|uniref:AAA family ATPase n=1 Tax=Oscillatoria sp. HE19RPO TaxID=2954806 RepID=UPI0020C40EAB|nr:AAA family ATPase [Oscillatoria sp. HE19RPO]